MLAEIIFASFFLVLVFLFFLQSLGLNFLLSNGIIASGFFPRILTILLIVLLIIYIISLILKRKQYQPQKTSSRTAVWRQCILIGTMIASIWLGKYLGVFLATGILLIVTLVFVQKLSWVRSAIFSVITTIFLYILFQHMLGLNISNGIIFG